MTEHPPNRAQDQDGHRLEGPDGDLPPGSHIDHDDIPGHVREAQPYVDAPADGKFAPDAYNPPPPA